MLLTLVIHSMPPKKGKPTTPMCEGGPAKQAAELPTEPVLAFPCDSIYLFLTTDWERDHEGSPSCINEETRSRVLQSHASQDLSPTWHPFSTALSQHAPCPHTSCGRPDQPMVPTRWVKNAPCALRRIEWVCCFLGATAGGKTEP